MGISGVLVVAYARIDQADRLRDRRHQPAGLYGAVYSVLDQAHFVPISILTTLSPVIAACLAGGSREAAPDRAPDRELLAIASFGALAFAAVAAGPVVRLVFGREFSHAASALPVLAGAFVLHLLRLPERQPAARVRTPEALVWISLVALVANIAGTSSWFRSRASWARRG